MHVKRCSLLAALIMGMAVASVGASEGPEVGEPRAFLEMDGLQSCRFLPADAPGGPALVCSRFNRAGFAWEILRAPLDGSAPEVIALGREPDVRGSVLVWIGTEPGRSGIWRDDLSNDEPPEQVSDRLDLLAPSLAADGTIACTRKTQRRTGIYLLRPGADKPERLAYRDERQPVWAPTGERMLAIKTEQVWLLQAHRWQELISERLTDGGRLHFDPAWGPNGQWIAFATGWTVERATIGLMRLADRRTWLLDLGVIGARSPVISPDGTKLAFVAGDDEQATLYVCGLQLQ